MTLRSVVFLSGGVGGSRLLHGMAQALPASTLTAVVNTGDDFEHWGLTICPDLDTVMYTLAGLADEARGFGLAEETFRAREQMGRYGEPTWFGLGDRDLATHLVRSQALRTGATLTAVTARLCGRLGVHHPVLPMSDTPQPTWLDTEEQGTLPFQTWLVERGAPAVRTVRFEGNGETTPQVLEALERADLVVIGPSNPYVSIDPMLRLRGVRERLQGTRVVAVSPIVAGRAVKGPLADMLRSLAGREPSPAAIAAHYAGVVSGLVVEHGDEGTWADLPIHATRTVMGGASDRARLSREVLAFAERLR